MRTIATLICTALASFCFAQDTNFDNTKLLPLLGEWTGTTSFQGGDATTGTIKATKMLEGNWIRLDLKFDLEGTPVEAVALLSAGADGIVEGHFFASMSNHALIGKGKVTEKKLMITANSLSGEDALEFEFDMSVADVLKFSAKSAEDQSQFLLGDYKKKK